MIIIWINNNVIVFNYTITIISSHVQLNITIQYLTQWTNQSVRQTCITNINNKPWWRRPPRPTAISFPRECSEMIENGQLMIITILLLLLLEIMIMIMIMIITILECVYIYIYIYLLKTILSQPSLRHAQRALPLTGRRPGGFREPAISCVCICMYTCMYVYIYIYIYIHMCVYIYIYTHTPI